MKWVLFDVQEILPFLYFNSPNSTFSCLPKFNCFPPGLLPGCWVGLSDDNYLLWAPLLLLGPSITGICTFPPLSHNVELCPWCGMYKIYFLKEHIISEVVSCTYCIKKRDISMKKNQFLWVKDQKMFSWAHRSLLVCVNTFSLIEILWCFLHNKYCILSLK